MTTYNRYHWVLPAFMVVSGLIATAYAAHSVVQTQNNSKLAEANICQRFAEAAAVTPAAAQLAPDYCGTYSQFALTKP